MAKTSRTPTRPTTSWSVPAAPAPRSPAGWPQSGASVIVVEAGKSDNQFLVKKPGHDRPDARGARDQGSASTGASTRRRRSTSLDRKMPVPRGKVRRRLELDQRHGLRARQPRQLRLLGGRGQHRLGRRQVNAAYQRMEDFEDGANDYRGAGGPIKVDPQHARRRRARCSSSRPPPTPSASRSSTTTTPSRRRASAGCSRTPPPACATAPRAATSTTSTPAPSSCRREMLVRKVVIENGRAIGIEVTDKDGGSADDPRRQGGHPLGRLRRLGAAPDALRHRPRPAPARPRHRRASRTCRSATTCTTTCSTR